MVLTLFVWTSKWRLIYLSPPCFCLFPALTRTPQQNHDCRPSALASLYYRLRKGDTSWPWPWWVWPSLHCIIALKASKKATGARFFLKKITTPWPLRGRRANPSGQPDCFFLTASLKVGSKLLRWLKNSSLTFDRKCPKSHLSEFFHITTALASPGPVIQWFIVSILNAFLKVWFLFRFLKLLAKSAQAPLSP